MKDLLQSNLKEINSICNLIKLYKFENEQFVLNWMDNLNRISVIF